MKITECFLDVFGRRVFRWGRRTYTITSAAVVGTAHACAGLARPQREGAAGAGAGAGAEKATVPADAAEGGAS